METSLFSFDLPEELIAQYPPERRGTSRLLVLDRRANSREHKHVSALPELVEPGTVLVLNDSRVRKARLFAQDASPSTTGASAVGVSPVTASTSRVTASPSPTGTTAASTSPAAGRRPLVEFLLLKEHTPGVWQVLTNKARQKKTGRLFLLPGNRQGEITGEYDGLKLLRITPPPDDAYLEAYGHIPLPPYIKRGDQAADSERYQTIYARTNGSAAAPTAGLHFTTELLNALRAAGVEIVMLTLHVGLGTFLPIRTASVEEHRMHTEEFHISEQTAGTIEQALAQRRKILAVGTTAVRALEAAYQPALHGPGRLKTGRQKTDIFIYPGYRFNVVSEMFTNFHTPGSTLLLLVSAFAGVEAIKETYQLAIRERYRFFSYGDAMLIR